MAEKNSLLPNEAPGSIQNVPKEKYKMKPGGRGGPGGGPGGRGRAMEKPRDALGTTKRILTYLRDFKLQLVIVAVTLVITAVTSVAATYFLKPIFNDLAEMAGQSAPDLSHFIETLLMLGAIYLLSIASSYLYSRLMLNISTGVLRQVRIDMFRHMQSLEMRFFDSHTHGELMSHFTNDTDTLREMISNSLPQGIQSLITIAGVFAMMLYLSWQLTLLVLVMLVIIIFIIKKIGGRSANYFIKQQRALSQVNGFIEEHIEGQRVVKVFCHEPQTKQEFAALNEQWRDAAANAQTYGGIMGPIMGNLSHVHYAATAAVGAALAIGGILDIGTIASFLQYTRNFSNPVTQISQQFNNILSALAGAERIFALIDVAPESDGGDVVLVNMAAAPDGTLRESAQRTRHWAWKVPRGDGGYDYVEVRGDVRFHDVVFGYVPDKIVLRDISLYAKPGQKIAFVGSTGAGKTTITNLLNRFYEINEGTITYDGIDIKRIRKDALRRSMSMVLQDTHLFTGTVRDNIRYGRLDATDEDVVAAAKLANAHFFISHLPQGYDTVLTGDGSNLSQGQRQLIAIARAAVADPPVLILDEATSSIDTRTEKLIERGMDTLMEGRTVFVIAHRLSTVRNSSAIMVLEHGEIIERGDHDDLLAQHGRYHALYTGMFELD